MSEYELFISHSWTYGAAYSKLLELLQTARNFSFQLHAVPHDDPIHAVPDEVALRAAIAAEMDRAETVLLMTGVYSTFSRWIDAEVLTATSYRPRKPVIAVEPLGAAMTSQFVRNHADRIVGWYAPSIVAAVKELSPARQ